MNLYVFPMEKVLNYREQVEREIMEEMGQVQQRVNGEKLKLKNMKEDLETMRNKTYATIEELRYKSLYEESLVSDIEVQVQVVKDWELELEEHRGKLIEAQKQRKIMEKLKEKDYEKYIEKIRKEQQKELDELAVLKYSYSG